MDGHPPKNGINRYWSIAMYELKETPTIPLGPLKKASQLFSRSLLTPAWPAMTWSRETGDVTYVGMGQN